MRTVFFTSDTHFGHKNIIKFQPLTRGALSQCGHKFDSVEGMDEYMIQVWNDKVRPGDLVIHLGDFAFAPQARIKELLSRLNGDIAILPGNHDKALSKENFQEELRRSKLAMLAFIPPCHEVKFNDRRYILNHYAMRTWNKMQYGACHLFGHSHGNLKGEGKSVDVGVDSTELIKFTGRNDLSPWSLDEVEGFLATKARYSPDHH